jgi:hypothetical protein
VYAFDADNPASPPLWQTSFIHPPDVTSVPSSGYVCNEVQPEIGIISTPVIDLASGTLYVVAMTKEAGTYFFRLHALSVNTGVEVGTGHVVIQASAPGTGDGNDGQGQVPFNAFQHKQRAALPLSMARYMLRLPRIAIPRPITAGCLATTHTVWLSSPRSMTRPNGRDGGIWNGGPAADADGNLFAITGNGTFDGPSPAGHDNWGDSFLRLAGNALTVLDFLTPFNQVDLAAADLDLGSSGPLLLPDQAVGPPH